MGKPLPIAQEFAGLRPPVARDKIAETGLGEGHRHLINHVPMGLSANERQAPSEPLVIRLQWWTDATGKEVPYKAEATGASNKVMQSSVIKLPFRLLDGKSYLVLFGYIFTSTGSINLTRNSQIRWGRPIPVCIATIPTAGRDVC